MDDIEFSPLFPLDLRSPPPVDAVRPGRCPRCGAGCGLPGSRKLVGHGLRTHDVVAANDADGQAAPIVTTWSRRFLCLSCGRTSTVGPPFVLRRYLYSLAAILTAWLLAIRPPLGDGRDQEAVYAQQGVDRRPGKPPREKRRSGVRRWRSLARWAEQIETWWPARPVSGTTWSDRARGLLLGFVPGGGGRDGLRQRAVASHARQGVAM